MITTRTVANVMQFAYTHYANQYDRYGVPYIFHVMHIAEEMNEEKEVLCALLHNILNDSFGESVSLENLELGQEVLDSIHISKRKRTESYKTWIDRIKTNQLASKIEASHIRYTLEKEEKFPSGISKKQISNLKEALNLLEMN